MLAPASVRARTTGARAATIVRFSNRCSRDRELGLETGATESADAGRRHRNITRFYGKHLVARQYHLRDALAVVDANGRRRGIAHDHHPLVGIVGVDRARRVGY